MNFNLTRFLSLIKRDWIINKRLLALLLAATPILFYLICLIQKKSDYLDPEFLHSWFSVFLFAGGAIFTSTVMWEFGSTSKRLQYLTVPASHLEKFLSRWIYSLILYPIFISLVAFILCKIFGLEWTIQDGEIRSLLLKIYYFGHAIIFMFAIWFNRYVLPKSFLSMISFAMVFALIIALLGMIIFPELIDKSGFGITVDERTKIEPTDWFKDFAEYTLFPIAKFIFWWIIPPFLWVVGYFKLTEKEA